MAKALNPTFCLFLIAITIGCATSARLLNEVDPLPGVANPLPTAVPTPVLPQPSPSTLLPSGQFPAVAPVDDTNDDVDSPIPDVDSDPPAVPTTPSATSAPVAGPATAATSASGGSGAATSAAGDATSASGGSGAATSAAGGATSTAAAGEPTMSFYMHDIVGGSHPTARIVTGLVASEVSSVPFTKANNNIFPVSGGTPLTTANVNGFLSNNRNNLPFLAGLNGQSGTAGFSTTQSTTVIQNSGNNNIVAGGNAQPFVSGGQLSVGGSTLQRLMFGSITVIDDELTEDHELGSPVIGRAQGFYMASSMDGNSHTMVLTVMAHATQGGQHVEDTISLFGVHRTATPISHVAIIGGTGKFENAQGYATVESLPQVDQHTTDGVDTIMHVNIYVSE